MITPFRRGRIDASALAQLAKHLRDQGTTGLVVCGSTGEATALDESEQREVLEIVLQAVPGMPVAMEMSGYHLPQTLAWVQALSTYPLTGLLVPAPHCIRPSQSGLVYWFEAITDIATVPIIIYDIPYRTGSTLERQTLSSLAQHPQIQAIKDCGGDAGKTLALIEQGQLQVLAGEDLQMFATVAQGAVGAIAASAHLGTADFARLIHLLRAGELNSARMLWRTLVPWIEAVFAEPNPAPVKAMLAQAGQIANELRAPMTVCSDAHASDMQQLLAAWGSIERKATETESA